MPLNSRSPVRLHYLQNIVLIVICAAFTPLLTSVAILSTLISPFTKVAQQTHQRRKWRSTSSSSHFRARTILVTGVGMSKGLAIARSFYRTGHRVIGADFEPYFIPACGRFSTAIRAFYRLRKPCGRAGSASYVQDLVEIIRREKVELWVSCSGVASAIEDGEAAEMVERVTGCVAVQFGVDLTATLHEKYSFIRHTMELGLNVPVTYRVNSIKEALAVLHPKRGAKVDTKFIMKPELLDDSARADMTLLPLRSLSETDTHIQRLNPSKTRPFVLQQYIAGREYCTHSIVLKGKVHAFVACRSSDMLMHYQALPPSSALSQAMLRYTTQYVQKTASSPPITGHFSLDFLVQESVAEKAERALDVSNARQIENLQTELFPIECNPRAHTAVVLLNDRAADMADAYMTLLPSPPDHDAPPPHRSTQEPVVPSPNTIRTGYYWIGHDFVTKVLLPTLAVLKCEKGIGSLMREWMDFVRHVAQWHDGTYEVWDPWPAWCLYVLFLPGCFSVSLWERRWWSRCNVSTGKFFGV
ncbi:hypothetical protein DSL72_004806 [Monilinia vaccinii-corymbosi]|uniref:ATP-grasp domain-containing protein n=1 Tax=Monilinia vaccinii-corymbosi TaxID=61207 RepID=A0A8A3P337_9HELO|nr:hypothetical protein DSL72_004806 [Monilinia vaccinii-corymbosi]